MDEAIHLGEGTQLGEHSRGDHSWASTQPCERAHLGARQGVHPLLGVHIWGTV